MKQPKRQCTATAKSTRRRCIPATDPRTVCHKHGGRAPQVKTAARRREMQAQAQSFLSGEHITPVQNRFRELSQLGGEILALKDWLAAKVADLDSLDYEDQDGRNEALAVVQLFERSLDRCLKLLSVMSRLDLQAQAVLIDQQRLQIVRDLLDAALSTAAVTLEFDDYRAILDEYDHTRSIEWWHLVALRSSSRNRPRCRQVHENSRQRIRLATTTAATSLVNQLCIKSRSDAANSTSSAHYLT